MKKIILLIVMSILIISGCGLSGIRVDGTYEKDGEKITGGTEWHFNKATMQYYKEVSEKDIRALVYYHKLVTDKEDAKKLDEGDLADKFDVVLKKVNIWVKRRQILLD